MIRFFTFLVLFMLSVGITHAQTDTLPSDDLLGDMLGLDEPTTEYAKASFKTNHIINLHSIENTAGGVLDFKIQHRFGNILDGSYTLWGLDQASMRIGFDYGINNRLQVGVGRSTYEKLYDGYFKYRILRQSSGVKNMPVSVSYLGSTAVKSVKWATPLDGYKKVHRVFYTFQLMIARKFSEGISLQLSPTVVHRNLVANRSYDHDIVLLGIGGRIKLSRRTAFNFEYIPILSGRLTSVYQPSASIGLDIETGGHVFQLHLTNSNGMAEKSFLTETVRNPDIPAIYFGFNLSRVFTITQVGRDPM
jgi:Membrane bound beta barrel domain (DUF5777)